MGELAQTPEAARLKAQATLKAREDGIRAAAIKQGRTLERAEIMQALGVQRVEEASQIAQLRAERDARVSPQEEAKHGRFRFYQGVAFGGALIGSLVAIGAAWYTTMIINPAFDAAGRIRAQSDITDALVRSQQEPPVQPYTNPGQDVTRPRGE